MVSAAAAVLIRRCRRFPRGRSIGLFQRYYHPLTSRWLATQPTSAADQTHNNNNNAMESGIPWLVVSSGTKPESRYVYNLSTGSDPKVDHLKLDRELSLPEIAKNRIVGSSQGYLISMPISTSFNTPVNSIHAINPLTGDILFIPSIANNFCDPKDTKVILSPSLDMAVLIANSGSQLPAYVNLPWTHESLLSGPSYCWNILPLPSTMYRVTDCIFHKGCLCLTDVTGAITIFDDHFFEAERDLSAVLPAFSCFWDAVDVRRSDADTSNSILMESHDGNNLYALFKDNTAALKLSLFKLDKGFCNWEEVQNIGDSVVFVGKNHAMSLSAHDFPVLQSNSIYFTGYGFGFDYYASKNKTGAYYVESQSFEYFGATKGDQIFTLTDLPPIWLKPVASSATPCPVITHG